ncbi:MAG: polymerase, partial [Solirubrobacterales bacterium]|nr:polymerase [Solirubrobacterales bacterium]
PAPGPAAAPAPAPAPTASSAPASTPTASGGCANANAIPTAANVAAIRAAVLCLVNAQRANAGLSQLGDNGQLQAAAQGHSDDMVARGYFSHTSADGRDMTARIQAAGYVGQTWGENIAWGGGSLATPAQIVGNWMNSAGHRANILNGAYSDSGIGVAIGTPPGGQGATYTHDFGSR